MDKIRDNVPALGVGQRAGQRVRLSDLAEHLNLTKGTVSRALNGYPDISDRTRKAVQEAARKLGYRPLALAQAVRTGRVRAVGLVLQVNEHDGHRPFLAEFLAGVSGHASEADWTMTMATGKSDADTLRLMEKLWEDRKVDGFIVPRTYRNDVRVNFLRKREVPFVLYGRSDHVEDCAWYDIDGRGAMADAVARLSALGHSRIAFVEGGRGYTYSQLRLKGYRDGLEAAGLSFYPELLGGAAVSREQGAALTRKLLTLTLTQPPTAIVFAVDRAALGAYDAARAFGLTIGSDLSVISYDGIPEGAYADPPLSTFSVDSRRAGARLAEILIDRVCGADPASLRELADATFLARGSHGIPRQSPDNLRAHVAKAMTTLGGNQ